MSIWCQFAKSVDKHRTNIAPRFPDQLTHRAPFALPRRFTNARGPPMKPILWTPLPHSRSSHRHPSACKSMYQMYSSALGLTNYAGQSGNCLLKPNRSNKSTGKRQTAAKCSRFKSTHSDQNENCKMSFNRSTKFKRSSESNNGSTAEPTHRCPAQSTRLLGSPVQLSKCKMLILTVIYSLLCTGVSGQFFRPQPLSNNLGASSFDSPNEINSIELFVHENARNHHTIDYEIVDGINPPLVVRRSDVFVLGLKFRKPYDPRRDKVRLEFMFGKFFFVINFFLLWFRCCNLENFDSFEI